MNTLGSGGTGEAKGGFTSSKIYGALGDCWSTALYDAPVVYGTAAQYQPRPSWRPIWIRNAFVDWAEEILPILARHDRWLTHVTIPLCFKGCGSRPIPLRLAKTTEAENPVLGLFNLRVMNPRPAGGVSRRGGRGRGDAGNELFEEILFCPNNRVTGI